MFREKDVMEWQWQWQWQWRDDAGSIADGK